MGRFEIQMDHLKYGDLLAKQYSNNKHYFLISELIDNSISSWEKNKLPEEELNIHIEFNIRKKTIICVDNAYGMSQKELEESIVQNKYKSGDEFNKFGVGMKNCAFWFGTDLEIWTNQGKEELYTSVLCSKFDKNDTVQWICELNHMDSDELKLIGRGTKIKISKCHEGRVPRKGEMNEIKDIISRKYFHWLNNGVSIIIDGFDGHGKAFEGNGIKLSPSPIKSQIIPNELIDKFIDSFNRIGELKILNDKKEEIILNVKNHKPIEFSLCKKIGSVGPFEFKFGVQEHQKNTKRDETKSYRKLYGIGTLQKNRYINIPNVNAIEGTNWDYVRGNIKRMWGMVDFGDSFELDNNKKNFDFKDDITSWEDFLTEIGNDMEKICTLVKETLSPKEKIESNISKSDIERITRSLNEKSNFSKDISWISENDQYQVGKCCPALKIFDYTFSIYARSYSEDDEKYFFIQTTYPSDKRIEIFYNINHNVLKPLIQSANIDFEKSFYPLIVTLGINYAYIEKKLQSGKLIGIIEELSNNYVDILNKLLNMLVKK
ncbi:ATP-binding protein [Malacoplasma iowae]|uniref:ATP-binding protein n=1 Tax=Malacoplasma iowae TaxID=2116 RepID=UPI003873ACED|nr:ATP-binding protein [Malacoplasma iowae]